MKLETKATIQAAFISILFTIIVTGLLSGALYLINGMVLVNILFSLATFLVSGYLYNLYIIQRFNRFLISQQTEIDKEDLKNYLTVECCNCGKGYDVRINLVEDMIFKCDDCNTDNKVFYTFKTGRITEIPENTSVVQLIDKIVDDEQSR